MKGTLHASSRNVRSARNKGGNAIAQCCQGHSATWVLAIVMATTLVVPAAAQMPASIQATQNPKERCAKAIAFFDRYGASRTENSDGQRNQTRIGAEIDCQRGRYQEGITAIEDLLRRKKFKIPF